MQAAATKTPTDTGEGSVSSTQPGELPVQLIRIQVGNLWIYGSSSTAFTHQSWQPNTPKNARHDGKPGPNYRGADGIQGRSVAGVRPSLLSKGGGHP